MKKPESIEELRDIAFTIPDIGMEIKLKRLRNIHMLNHTLSLKSCIPFLMEK